uniref:glycosyltransferase family 2 protein n=1 Tax=Sulfurovum sp. TaxID=1969726 RepID=UPI0035664CFF
YKAEKFIQECLDSIFSQLPDSVEIIIVNDGTPDHSIEIIKTEYSDWLAKDQIVLIEQENAGPGAARNSGLAVARGEYIGFLDSDDVLLENYFSVLFETLNTYKADIVEFGFKRFQKLSDIQNDIYQPLYAFKGPHKIEEVRNEIFSVGIWFPSTRVYKKEIFEKVRFPEGVFYEDLMTIAYVFLNDLEAYFIDQPLIGYRFNPNSTTAVHTESHAIDLYKFYMSLIALDQTIPIEILKIKTARSIAYFYNELGSLDIPIIDILEDIRKIKKRLVLLKNLKYPDLLFFMLPMMYMFIDKVRLNKQSRK